MVGKASVSTVRAVAARARQRWSKGRREAVQAPGSLRTVSAQFPDLIGPERLTAPVRGDRVADRWNINHSGIAG